MNLSARGRIWIIAAAWLIALFLLLPGLIAIPVALNDSRFIALPHGSLSLRHFEALLSSNAWLASMGQSALIAFAATLLALTIGTACAVGLWRLGGRSAAAIAAIVLAPLILPPVVSALHPRCGERQPTPRRHHRHAPLHAALRTLRLESGSESPRPRVAACEAAPHLAPSARPA